MKDYHLRLTMQTMMHLLNMMIKLFIYNGIYERTIIIIVLFSITIYKWIIIWYNFNYWRRIIMSDTNFTHVYRKAPSFRYGDIRHVHRICVSNWRWTKQYIENQYTSRRRKNLLGIVRRKTWLGHQPLGENS